MSTKMLTDLAYDIELSAADLKELIIPLIFVGIIFGLLAFFGFRFLKIEICITGALVGFSTGITLLGNSVHEAWATIISIALAVIGVLLSAKIYKVMVFIYSFIIALAGGTAMFTPFINNLFETDANGAIIILLSVLLAIVVAYITCRIFKPLYILLTAFGGMLTAFTAFALVIAPESDTFITVMMILGLLTGIPAAIKQFKSCKELEF